MLTFAAAEDIPCMATDMPAALNGESGRGRFAALYRWNFMPMDAIFLILLKIRPATPI